MQARIKLSNIVGAALCVGMLITPYQGVMAQEKPIAIDGEETQVLVEGNNSIDDESIEPSEIVVKDVVSESASINSEILLEDPAALSNSVVLPVIQMGDEGFETTIEQNESIMAAASRVVVARNTPRTLLASTGNLYWTEQYVGDDVNYFVSASVFRTSKNGTPNSVTRLYYEAQRADGSYRPSFDGIVYANLGTWYGYFIANYTDCVGSCPTYIKRIPLAGGSATIIAKLPNRAAHLQTDGSYLYWTDEFAVQRIPISGGAIMLLTTKTGPCSRLYLADNFVYFVDGRNSIKRVDRAGGAAQTLVTTTNRVTDFYVHMSATTRTIYWGEGNGLVKSKVLDSTAIVPVIVYQSIRTGRSVSAVGFDGTRVFWIDCTSGNSYCSIRKWQSSVRTTLVNESAGVGARNLVWDSTQLFWGSVSGIEKYVH